MAVFGDDVLWGDDFDFAIHGGPHCFNLASVVSLASVVMLVRPWMAECGQYLCVILHVTVEYLEMVKFLVMNLHNCPMVVMVSSAHLSNVNVHLVRPWMCTY